MLPPTSQVILGHTSFDGRTELYLICALFHCTVSLNTWRQCNVCTAPCCVHVILHLAKPRTDQEFTFRTYTYPYYVQHIIISGFIARRAISIRTITGGARPLQMARGTEKTSKR